MREGDIGSKMPQQLLQTECHHAVSWYMETWYGATRINPNQTEDQWYTPLYKPAKQSSGDHRYTMTPTKNTLQKAAP